MSDGDEHSIDLVRQALQVHVNESGADLDNGEWLVTHYVAIVGLYRAKPDGSVETRPLMVAPQAQAAYVTNGLFGEAPELLSQLAECDD